MDSGGGEFKENTNAEFGEFYLAPMDSSSPHYLPDKTVVASTPAYEGTYSEDLPPDQQDAFFYREAVAGIAGASQEELAAKVYAARLFVGGDVPPPALSELLNDVSLLPVESETRAAMLAELSKHPGTEAAWDDAVAGAAAIDAREGRPYGHSALAKIAEGQTDSDRLWSVFDAAHTLGNANTRDVALRTVVKQHLAAGSLDKAMAARRQMGVRHTASLERDEAELHIIAEMAKRGDIIQARVLLESGIPHPQMSTWGEIKLAKYDQNKHYRSRMTTAWGVLDTRRRAEVVHDLIDAQRLDDACELAQAISASASPDLIDKEVQTTAVIDVARAIAPTNPDSAKTILQDLWEDSVRNMLRFLSEAPYGSERSGELAKLYAASADRATAELITFNYHDRPQSVREAIDGADLFGEPSEIARARIYSTVACDLARAGHTADAVRLASNIPDSSQFGTLRSETFTNVGLIAQARRRDTQR